MTGACGPYYLGGSATQYPRIQILQGKKKVNLFKISCEDDLFDADFGNSLNFQFYNRPSSEYNSNPLKKGPFRKAFLFPYRTSERIQG
jgi:hypothetical protein